MQTSNKYQEVAFDIKKWWQTDQIIVTPLVLSPTGVVRTMPDQSPTILKVPPCLLSQVAPNTCSKVRNVLSDAVHCLITLIMSVYRIYNWTRTIKKTLTQPPNRYLVKWPALRCQKHRPQPETANNNNNNDNDNNNNNNKTLYCLCAVTITVRPVTDSTIYC